MPFGRFVMIIAAVILAAAVTVWLGVLIAEKAALSSSAGYLLLPILLAGYLAWRGLRRR